MKYFINLKWCLHYIECAIFRFWKCNMNTRNRMTDLKEGDIIQKCSQWKLYLILMCVQGPFSAILLYLIKRDSSAIFNPDKIYQKFI